MPVSYELSRRPTGWYAPELLSNVPLLEDPADEDDLPPLDVFIKSVENGIRNAERGASVAIEDLDTVPMDIIDMPSKRTTAASHAASPSTTRARKPRTAATKI